MSHGHRTHLPLHLARPLGVAIVTLSLALCAAAPAHAASARSRRARAGLTAASTTATPATETTATETTATETTATETTATETATSAPVATSTTTAPAGGESQEGGQAPAGGSATQTTTTTTSGGAPAPRVVSKAPQRKRPRQAAGGGRSGSGAPRSGGTPAGAEGGAGHAPRAGGRRAPAPGAAGRSLAPSPLSLGALSGVPGVFLEAYDVPPFLLPIYQAAGIAYGIPWQVLAAINEVETNYGSDLNLSSAGAEGWMQFLPAEWRLYGVDATGSGYADPYNPADAIFAAARYLASAGGGAHIRSAVFAYNHSQSYVASVMLRAQLLGSMPPDMLGAISDLVEARFPVHAPSHFADGFPQAPAGSGAGPLVGTTIYSEAQAPVIAVQDGTIVAIGDSPTLGAYVRLRDAHGDLYTYAGLGSVASLYPVLSPRSGRQPSRHATAPAPTGAPRGPASAGAQPHPPLSSAAIASGLAFGVMPVGEGAPAPRRSRPAAPARHAPVAPEASAHSFSAGPEKVTLSALRPGVHVVAGTIIGHLSAGAEAHMVFQIRPAGAGAPLIDPKPILDSWVALEDSGIFKAKGESPFLAASPTAGQALLESKSTLEQQVLRNGGIRLYPCGRADIESGRIDRRVLATLELLSVSGLQPTVSRLACPHGQSHGELHGYARGEAVDISAVNGVPIAGHAGPGGVADQLERKLMTLEGTMKPRLIAGPIDYPGAGDVVTLPQSRGLVHVSFAPAAARRASAHAASAGTQLTPEDWAALDARLGQIPDATVASEPSSAATPDGAEAEAEVEAGGR